MKRLFLLAALLLPSLVDAGIYSMEAGDLRHSNRNLSPATSQGPLTEDWVTMLKGGANNHPLILSDKVVVIDAYYARCVRRSDGAPLWNAYIGNQCKTGSYDASRDLIYVVGTNGNLQALRASDGGLSWSHNEPKVGSDTSAASPVILPGQIIVATAGSGIISLDPDTHAVQWRHATTECHNTPAFDNGRLYFATKKKKIFCLDASNGAKLWETTTSSEKFTSAVTLSDDLCYVMTNWGRVEAYQRSNGAQAWTYQTASMSSSNLAICENALIATSDDRNVHCLDPRTGALKWKRQFNGNFALCAPLIVCGVIYVSGCADEYYALDLNTGETLWIQEHNYQNSFVDWAVDGDRLFVMDAGGRLHCYKPLEPADPGLCACLRDPSTNPNATPEPLPCALPGDASEAGLAMYLDADDGVQVDAESRVTFWRDKSGKGRHAISADFKRPYFSGPDALGRHAVSFPSNGDKIMSVNRSSRMMASAQQMTLLAKLRVLPRIDYSRYFFGGSSGRPGDVLAFGSQGTQWLAPSWSVPANLTFSATTLYSYRASAAGQVLRINGRVMNKAGLAYPANTDVPFKVGGNVNMPGTFFSGDIYKLMVFDRALSDAEIASIEACWTDASDPTMPPRPTATSTITASPTSTRTPTRTPTVTITVSSTSTATPTTSPTQTPTLTASPTLTVTATNTPYLTPTVTPTVTVTTTPAAPKEEDCPAKIEDVVLVPNPWSACSHQRHRISIKLLCTVDKVEVDLYTASGNKVCSLSKAPVPLYPGDWLSLDFPELSLGNGTYYVQVRAKKGVSQSSMSKSLVVLK